MATTDKETLENKRFLTQKDQTLKKNEWNLFLILCTLTVTCSSFQFGFNIASLNSSSEIIKSFIKNEMFIFKKVDELSSVENKINITESNHQLIQIEAENEKLVNVVWTLLNSLFVIGGILGAFISKFVLDILGRKNGILFKNVFSILGSIFVFISVYIKSPVWILISRFLFGVHGAMTVSMLPTYITEISPGSLRGQLGALHQLFITFGILVSQTLGLKEIFGNEQFWYFILAFPIIPAVFGNVCLFFFFPETPRYLLIKRKDYEGARKALESLRNTKDVLDELEEINGDSKNSGSQSRQISMIGLFTDRELRWPLITSIVVCSTQQLCGLNAIFFYSAAIFKDAGIKSELIPYAIFAKGLVNLVATIFCIPLIDKLGRKPLLTYPIFFMIINYIFLTIFLTLKEKVLIFSYMSVICIIAFVICFAVGLGPVPFLYTAECFRQNARSSAMAVCTLANWFSSLILTLAFPFLQEIIQQYVFLIFTAIICASFLIIVKKVPETKGKGVEQILIDFNK